MTAYFGLLDVGKLKRGGHRRRLRRRRRRRQRRGADREDPQGRSRVIGIAGGEEKCRWLIEELGFDAAIDYKAEDVRRALREQRPTAWTSTSTTSAARSSTPC